MRPSYPIAFFCYLILRIYAGGYQGRAERLVIYFAYQFDGLNSPENQVLGLRCKKWDSGTCRSDEWVACQGKAGRCDFNELTQHMGKLPQKPNWVGGGEPQDTPTPGLVETAINCYKHYRAEGKSSYNFPPYRVFKGAPKNFNQYVVAIGRLVADAWSAHGITYRHLFEAFRAALNHAVVARIADHGRHIEVDAQEQLGARNGITGIPKMDLGEAPYSEEPIKQRWTTVD